MNWQLIETAPKDDTRVLVSDGTHFAAAERGYGCWIVSPMASDADGFLLNVDFEPTHWLIPGLPNNVV